MKLDININDYISEDEIKEIVKDEFRFALQNQLRMSKDIEAYITNISYRYVWDMVNDVYKEYDCDFEKLLIEKIENIINNLTSYSVFREATLYGDKNSIGQEMLNKIVEESKPQIEERVTEIINNYDFRELKDEISDTIYDCIWQKFNKTE